MEFEQKLLRAKIVKRYKRFLSDLELESGELIHAHVPNTGSMKTCWEAGWYAYISKSNDPKRKLPYTWELTDNGESLICVNTNLPNRIVKEALELKQIPELAVYSNVKPEQKVLDSRIDFFLTEDGQPDAYVEVKNVTLKGEGKKALFPDAVSTRGQKHLKDLIQLKEQGHRSIMLYLINRSDVNCFEPARDIDPEYANLLNQACEAGVEILPYQTKLSPQEIKIHQKLKYKL